MREQACEQLTLFQVGSPASHSPQPEKDRELPMTVISGRKCSALLWKSSPLTLLAKMLLESSAWQSRLVSLSWKAESLTVCRTRITTTRYYHNRSECCSTKSSKNSLQSGTRSRHLLFRLVASMPRTSDTESPLLPTPISTIATHGGPNQRDSSGRPGLQMAAMMWQTPNVPNGGRVNPADMSPTGKMPDGRKRQVGLEHQAKMVSSGLWPTPTVNGNNNRAGCSEKAGDGLATAARMWPTPTTDSAGERSAKYKQGGTPLTVAVKMWPTPKSSDAIMGMTARTSGRPIEKSTHLQTQVFVAERQMWPTPTASAQNTASNSSENRTRPNGIALADAARLWPTPTSRDYKDGSAESCQNVPVNGLLGRAVHQRLVPTPTSRDWKNATASEWDNPNNTRNLNRFIAKENEDSDIAAERLGQLHPDWVEWLMGVPVGWTDIDAVVEHPAPPIPGAFWPEEPPGIPRVASGIPNRTDRLKGLGNMVVPPQFFPIYKAIADIERGAV